MKISPTNWQKQVKIKPFLKKKAFTERNNVSFSRGFLFREKVGCVFVRQKGDHLIFHYENAKRAIVIPKYDEITVTIIRNNMKTAGMTRAEYFTILRSI